MLHVHRSERADQLVAGLAAVIREGLTDPFATELIAVPAKGVERWLTQRLSHGDDGEGVCANVRFVSPRTLIDDVVTATREDPTADEQWSPARMMFALLDLDAQHSPTATTGPDGWRLPRERPVAAAADLAHLFVGYQTQRPHLVRAWAAGDMSAVPRDLAWQPVLWRRLRDHFGTASPAEQLERAAEVLAADRSVVDLPDRFSVFGPTRLTRDQLAVLGALAQHREVHLWLPHPSPALWEAVRPHAPAAARTTRRGDPTVGLARHPLLASLGRDARELQLLLADAPGPVEDTYHSMPTRPTTLLGRLQADLATDTVGVASTLDPADRSLQVHACHGPARQVEVLREVLLGLLEADPTLEPRDVLVMCPDIEAYAPLISATFGLAEGLDPEHVRADHPGHRLRVRLADRSLRQTNPLLGVIAALLELADARVTASQVLDLAAAAPVRRRFRLDDEDMELLRDWVARTGVRWGFDADHRAPFRLSQVAQNTWASGLDRLLLGAAMSEDEVRWLGTALPLDDVDSGDVDLAGRLAELLDRLADTLARLTGPQSLTRWLTALSTALDQLTAVTDRDAWQLAQARRELADVAEGAADLADALQLSLGDLRALLADRLRGRPTRANFRTGNLTMCSMVPMRSVPHRVVCLLGLDDGAFPRTTVIDGDDLLAREPMVGERNPRSEDRQLLLDAILAAEDHLVLLYTGADERTNAKRPPAVPVGEILDAVDAVVAPRDGRRGQDQILVRHPLQPFDARNFAAGALGGSRPFSFDRSALAGARAALGPRRPAPVLLPAPLDPVRSDPVELDALVRFLEHPVRAFLRQRLELGVSRDVEEVDDDLTVSLEALEMWAVGDRMLQARLAGADAATVGQAEYRRGSLPPGNLGSRIFRNLLSGIDPLLQASVDVRGPQTRTVDVSVDLPDGRRLAGTVGGVHDSTVVRVVYSQLGVKHRLRAWAQVLALSAGQLAGGSVAWRAVTVGRRGKEAGARRSTLGPVPPDEAGTLLTELVDLYDRGLREPLPLVAKTSQMYAGMRSTNRPPVVALDKAAWKWTGQFGEQHDREHEMAWGSEAPLDVLTAAAPAVDEDWFPDETSRFGMLARRLWTPLLAAEQVDEL